MRKSTASCHIRQKLDIFSTIQVKKEETAISMRKSQLPVEESVDPSVVPASNSKVYI